MDQRPKWKRLNSKASRRKHRNRSSEPWAKQDTSEKPRRYMGKWTWLGAIQMKRFCSSRRPRTWTARPHSRRAGLPCGQHPASPVRGDRNGASRGGGGGRAPLACCLRVSLEAERGGCALHGAPYRGGVGGLGWGCSGRRSGGGGRPRPHRASRGQCWCDGLFMVLATRTYDNCPRPPPQRQCANAEKG